MLVVYSLLRDLPFRVGQGQLTAANILKGLAFEFRQVTGHPRVDAII